VAQGEAVAGKGFRRTGDDEVDDVEESVSARDLIDSEGIRSLLILTGNSGGLLVGSEAVRSDGCEAEGVSG